MTHPLMVANKFALPFSFFTLLVKYNYLHSRIRHDGSRFYFNDLKFYLKKEKKKVEFIYTHPYFYIIL